MIRNHQSFYDTLMQDCKSGNLVGIKNAVEAGAYLNFNDKKEDGTLLSFCAEGGHIDCLEYLLSIGGDIHYKNERALDMACLEGQLDALKYLISRGAKVVDESISSDNRTTAFFWAVKKKRAQIVHFLFDEGFKPFYGTYSDPLEMVARIDDAFLVEIFLTKGAGDMFTAYKFGGQNVKALVLALTEKNKIEKHLTLTDKYSSENSLTKNSIAENGINSELGNLKIINKI